MYSVDMYWQGDVLSWYWGYAKKGSPTGWLKCKLDWVCDSNFNAQLGHLGLHINTIKAIRIGLDV